MKRNHQQRRAGEQQHLIARRDEHCSIIIAVWVILMLRRTTTWYSLVSQGAASDRNGLDGEKGSVRDDAILTQFIFSKQIARAAFVSTRKIHLATKSRCSCVFCSRVLAGKMDPQVNRGRRDIWMNRDIVNINTK